MDRDDRGTRPRANTRSIRSDLREASRSRSGKGAETVGTSDEQARARGGIVNVKTGVSPSGSVPGAPERYSINELDTIIFKLKKALLEVEGNGFDAQEFYNRALTLIDADHAALANSTGAALDDCRMISTKTLEATEEGYRRMARAISDWHLDFISVNDNAKHLQDTARKLVVDLQGCEKSIQQAVAVGIQAGILKGNRIIRASIIVLMANTVVSYAVTECLES
jgi:hypothetical protein